MECEHLGGCDCDDNKIYISPTKTSAAQHRASERVQQNHSEG